MATDEPRDPFPRPIPPTPNVERRTDRWQWRLAVALAMLLSAAVLAPVIGWSR